MHITVAGKQVETGEALRTHVRDGLAAIARKYFDHALEANVTFRRDAKGRLGAFFTCDINLKAGRNLFMRGEGEAADAHRAFEVAAEHLAKRLRRYRRRVNDHARSLAEGREAPEIGRQVVLQPEDEEGTAEGGAAAVDGGDPAAPRVDHSVVVAETAAEIARLSVGEAVMRLDLTQAAVLMFRNSASGALNVVYRRADGNVGWIDAPAA
jgi:ribosome hibernation promoting factor